MKGSVLKEYIKESGVPQWKIAEAIGKSEFHFCKMLHKELDDTTTEQVLNAIKDLKEQE